MPVYERRYFLSLKQRDLNKQQEKYDEQRQNAKASSNSKGNRQSRVSGDALKNRMKNGDIPLN